MREVLPQVDEVVDSAIPYFSAVSEYREAHHDGKTTEALEHYFEAVTAVSENPELRTAYLGLLTSVSKEQLTHSTQVVTEIEGEILLDDRNKGLITKTKYEKQLGDLKDPEVLQKRAETFVRVFKAVIPKEELADVVTKKPPTSKAKKELGRQREVARAQRLADREHAAKRRADEKAAEEERIKNIPQDKDIHLNIDKSTGLFVSGNNKTPDLADAERALLDSLISEALEHRAMRVAASAIKRNRIFRQITAGVSADDATKLFKVSMKKLRSKLWEEGLGNLIETTGEGSQRAYRINPNLHIHKVTEGQEQTWGQAPIKSEYRAPVESAERKVGKKEISWTTERVAIASDIVKQLRDLGTTRSGFVPVSKMVEQTDLDSDSATQQEFNRVAKLLEKEGIAITNAHVNRRQKRTGGPKYAVRLKQDNELVKQLLKGNDAPIIEHIESLISEEPN